MSPLVVAMVLVATGEPALRSIPYGAPAWIASTPEMQATLQLARRVGLSVTELFPNGASPAEWLFNHLDSVDQHHNEFSQTPPYTKLLVFGVPLSPALAPLLAEFQFVATSSEPFGFSATKAVGMTNNEVSK